MREFMPDRRNTEHVGIRFAFVHVAACWNSGLYGRRGIKEISGMIKQQCGACCSIGARVSTMHHTLSVE
jgi:hypothetical protein